LKVKEIVETCEDCGAYIAYTFYPKVGLCGEKYLEDKAQDLHVTCIEHCPKFKPKEGDERE